MFNRFMHGALCFVFVTPVAIAALVRFALTFDLFVHILLVPISGFDPSKAFLAVFTTVPFLFCVKPCFVSAQVARL